MVQENQDFVLYAGNIKTLEFTITVEETAAPFDLTGVLVKFSVAPFDENGTPVVAEPVIDLSSSGPQVTVVNALAGRVDVDLVEADTLALAEAGDTNYYIELETFSGTDSVVVAVGTMTVKPNVVNA
jgi:hypothetical protein